MKKQKYKFVNPCKNFIIVHEHNSFEREWWEKIKKEKTPAKCFRINKDGRSWCVQPKILNK